MIELNPVDPLMMKSETTQQSTSPRPYTKLWGKQIHMSGLDTSHRKFCNHTQVKVSGSMNTDPVNKIYTSQESMKEGSCG